MSLNKSEKRKISILSLTMNRFDAVKQCYGDNINNCGVHCDNPLELLVADNGSSDQRVIDYIASFHPAYHRLNKVNEGVGRAFNQLLVRCTGDFICLMGTDIKMQPGWLEELLKYADAVPNAGIIGIKCTAQIPEMTTRQDKYGRPCHAHYLDAKFDKVFGTMFFSRHVLETVGGFHEGFHPYGFEDSCLNNRVNLAGFTSLYVPGSAWQSTHIGEDCADKSDYRRMKDESLARNLSLFGKRSQAYKDRTLAIFEPLPAPRPPLTTEQSLEPVDLSKFDLAKIRETP
jgi:GT2 family glycosyltransferase